MSLYNFEYTISGPESVSPIKIFDDGKFTYFEFKDKESELPAIFYVNRDSTEGLINYRVNGPYIVVESLRERFTLRHGDDVVCVYNENLIKEREAADNGKKKKKQAASNPATTTTPAATTSTTAATTTTTNGSTTTATNSTK